MEDLWNIASQRRECTLASKKEMIERRRNNPTLSEVNHPKVCVDQDDEEMLDAKAAVMKMLKTPQKELSSETDVVNKDYTENGEVNAKPPPETVVAGVKDSDDHRDNIEIWKRGMLKQLKGENMQTRGVVGKHTKLELSSSNQ